MSELDLQSTRLQGQARHSELGINLQLTNEFKYNDPKKELFHIQFMDLELGHVSINLNPRYIY